MSQNTEPVLKFILFFALIGVALIIWGLVGDRDVIALSGSILAATSVNAIARLVK